MLEILKTMLPAMMGDALSAQGIAYAGTAAAGLQYALSSLVPKRMKSASEIWVQVVGRDWGPISEEQEEELASIVDTFLQTARKGTAKANLQLLARIIAGQKASKALRADEFMAYADVLASLSHEEIQALSLLYKSWVAQDRKSIELKPGQKIEAVCAQLARRATLAALVPSLVHDEDEFDAIFEGLARTGLLIRVNDIRNSSLFRPSKKFERLVSLASLEELAEKKMDDKV